MSSKRDLSGYRIATRSRFDATIGWESLPVLGEPERTPNWRARWMLFIALIVVGFCAAMSWIGSI